MIGSDGIRTRMDLRRYPTAEHCGYFEIILYLPTGYCLLFASTNSATEPLSTVQSVRFPRMPYKLKANVSPRFPRRTEPPVQFPREDN